MTRALEDMTPEELESIPVEILERACLYKCVSVALEEPEFIRQFNRLTGRKLGERSRRSGIEIMVDQATGFDKVIEAEKAEDMRAFVAFVDRFVFQNFDFDAHYD